jgi:hypothetical protein
MNIGFFGRDIVPEELVDFFDAEMEIDGSS